MAFNAFTKVSLDEERNLLIAKGTTTPDPGPGTKMFAAIIGVDAPDCRRTLPVEVGDPTADPWIAEIPNELVEIPDCDGEPFAPGESVYVVGSADSPEQGRELWVNKVPIDQKLG